MRQGRIHVRRLPLRLEPAEDGTLRLRCDRPGFWLGGPEPGRIVTPGQHLGWLEVLGVRYELHAPAGAAGRVVEHAGGARPPARLAVAHGQELLRLDPSAAAGMEAASGGAAAGASQAQEGLLVRSPGSGRFYRRPNPGAEPFVEPGSIVEAGTPLGLLEIMKTFHRIDYEPDPASGLPARARVLDVLLEDGEDVEAGTPLLRVAPE